VCYCWGDNTWGQLGDGTTTDRLSPRAVTSGLKFRQLNVGLRHTCGLTTDGAAYCWGSNIFGELGNGWFSGFNDPHPRPIRVRGGLAYRQVNAGYAHTCGVTTNNVAYCWGLNHVGQLGIGTKTGPERCFGKEPCSTTPAQVLGGLSFRGVGGMGLQHSCGVITDDRAYCWGSNFDGQLGDGTTTDRLVPTAVSGPM
jgi:alpha-tubulin suppressor-like RCC1 family protein